MQKHPQKRTLGNTLKFKIKVLVVGLNCLFSGELAAINQDFSDLEGKKTPQSASQSVSEVSHMLINPTLALAAEDH